MAKKSTSEVVKDTPVFSIGDRVEIHHFGVGKVIELRGPLGPGGAQVYRVLYRRKPKAFVEVLADQISHAKPSTSPKLAKSKAPVADSPNGAEAGNGGPPPSDRGGTLMAKKTTSKVVKAPPIYSIGDRVEILYFGEGTITELRGPLGPGGAQVYRIVYSEDPTPAYIEVWEDQIRPVKVKSPKPTRGKTRPIADASNGTEVGTGG